MSPTIHREKGYRFFFFMREETRKHVHVMSADGEAKFWLEPQIELARNHQLAGHQLKDIEVIVEAHRNEFIEAWERVFDC